MLAVGPCTHLVPALHRDLAVFYGRARVLPGILRAGVPLDMRGHVRMVGGENCRITRVSGRLLR